MVNSQTCSVCAVLGIMMMLAASPLSVTYAQTDLVEESEMSNSNKTGVYNSGIVLFDNDLFAISFLQTVMSNHDFDESIKVFLKSIYIQVYTEEKQLIGFFKS